MNKISGMLMSTSASTLSTRTRKKRSPSFFSGLVTRSPASSVFSLLVAVILGGILYHQLTGYDYPASPAFAFELNALGDLYEALIMAPLGLVGLRLLRRGSVWVPCLSLGWQPTSPAITPWP